MRLQVVCRERSGMHAMEEEEDDEDDKGCKEQ